MLPVAMDMPFYRSSQCTGMIMPSFRITMLGLNAHNFMGDVIDVMHTVQHGITIYVLKSFKKG
jgi:hypothetical protein